MGSEIFATRQRPVKIALVEDHGGTRAALEQIIADRAPQLELVLSVADGEALLRELHRQDIDVLLIDLGLPGMSGEELASQVRRQFPLLPVVIASGYGRPGLQGGASGDNLQFIAKPYSSIDLQQALDHAARTAASS